MDRQTWQRTPWQDMTPDQKFEFLHSWSAAMSRQLDELSAHMNDLHFRLQQVEGSAETRR